MQKLCHKGHGEWVARPGVLFVGRVRASFPFYQSAGWRAFWLAVLWRFQAASLGFIQLTGWPLFAGFAFILRAG